MCYMVFWRIWKIRECKSKNSQTNLPWCYKDWKTSTMLLDVQEECTKFWHHEPKEGLPKYPFTAVESFCFFQRPEIYFKSSQNLFEIFWKYQRFTKFFLQKRYGNSETPCNSLPISARLNKVICVSAMFKKVPWGPTRTHKVHLFRWGSTGFRGSESFAGSLEFCQDPQCSLKVLWGFCKVPHDHRKFSTVLWGSQRFSKVHSGWTRIPDKLTSIGLEHVFKRNEQVVDSPLAAYVSKLPPRLHWRIIAALELLIGQKRRRRNEICGKKSPILLPMNSHERTIVTLSPTTCIFWRHAGHLQSYFRRIAHRWACHTGQCKILKHSTLQVGPWSIQFVANIASSLTLKFTRSRKSLISVNYRCCDAQIETTFALDVESPRTERSCHSGGTNRSRELGTNSSGCKRSPNLWKNTWVACFASQEDPLAMVFL